MSPRIPVAALTAALVLLAGCGSTSTTSATSAMPSMTMSAPGSAAAQAPVSGNTVSIQNFAFAPASLAVKVGTTVTWTNADQDPHTVVAKGGQFKSGILNTGAGYTFTFTTAGTYDYLCSIHPFMIATVVVSA